MAAAVESTDTQRTPSMKAEIPQYCDYGCPFADFPLAETAGIRRTMARVWCRKLKELVNKNTACAWRQRRKTEGGKGRKSRGR